MSAYFQHQEVLDNEKEMLQKARPEGAPWIGVCLSGGGIRSASFCIGALQGLAQMKLLENVDYISTVSGGGYAGAWLSSWIAREGRDEVFRQLGSRSEEPAPLRHLRLHSTY